MTVAFVSAATLLVSSLIISWSLFNVTSVSATIEHRIATELDNLSALLSRRQQQLSEKSTPATRASDQWFIGNSWARVRGLLSVYHPSDTLREQDWRVMRLDRLYTQIQDSLEHGGSTAFLEETLREEDRQFNRDLRALAAPSESYPVKLYALCASLWLTFAGVLALAIREWKRPKSGGMDPDYSMAGVTLEAIRDGVIAINKNTTINYINQAAQSLTGWQRDAAMGKSLKEIFHICSSEMADIVESPEAQTLHGGQVALYEGNTLIITRDGGTHAIDSAISPIFDNDDNVIGAVVTFRDVARERDLSRKLIHQARHDPLTGLYNRNEFEFRLNRLYHATRNRDRTHSLLYIDLDQFKVVNDTCGHLAGDALLKQLGSILKNQVRTEDTLARLGGDEFGVLLETCSEEQAKMCAEKLLYNIQAFRFSWDSKTFTVGASIGQVTIHSRSHSVTAILAAADSACYAAKDAGRNRVVIYNEANYKLAQRDGEMQWVSRISQALEDNSFSLYFQSIVPIDNPSAVGDHYEVLLRLETGEGSISAGAFLPAAERYNLMGNLDRWVLSRTLLWLQQHPQHLQELKTCSINLSGQSIGDENFLKFVSNQFQIVRVPPSKICFEITETAIISDLSNAIKFISTLKSLGCQFALDDFGSGLSSFGYLRDLEVDYLKIDGVFVKDMINNPIDMAMVKSISEIGHVMEKKIVAEYVEHMDLVEPLKDCGVDFLQGYAIDSPRPLATLVQLLPRSALAG